MKLYLFDIDSTLIRSGNAAKNAFDSAFKDVFGIVPVRDGVEVQGSTDPQIHEDIAQVSFGRGLTSEESKKLKQRYLEELPGELQREEHYEVLPGVRELLEHLQQREDTILGLQTGNFKSAADAKLSRGGLAHYFSFGGFACDSKIRSHLVQEAVQRGRSVASRPIQEIYVIGDTPKDILAGKAVTAITVGVATGMYSVEELRASGADLVYGNFENIKNFLR